MANPSETTPSSSLPIILSAREVADYIGCDVGSVYRWIAAGRLRTVRFGGVMRVREQDIREFARLQPDAHDADSGKDGLTV